MPAALCFLKNRLRTMVQMNSDDVEFRLLTSSDADVWSTLRREALENDPDAFSSSVEEHMRLTVADVERRLACDPKSHFVVGAFLNGELVGIAGFYRELGPKTLHKGHVWGVYLTAAMRGRGIGRKIMESLLACAMHVPGLEQILISVASSQAAAASLYRSLGFEPYAHEEKALKVNGRYLDEDFLVLWLPAAGTK
jgi:ribosomal protein S18 acetylase RimI-like enzyme